MQKSENHQLAEELIQTSFETQEPTGELSLQKQETILNQIFQYQEETGIRQARIYQFGVR